MALHRIVVPHFVAGVVVDARGIVTEAAPIVRWSIGKPIAKVAAWAKSKGGTCTELEARA